MQRIEILKAWIEDDPKDPFNYYGLALEYEKLADKRAGDLFDRLLDEFQEYLPTYYTAAKYFEERDATKAKVIYEKGIQLAQSQNNAKTVNELKNALQNFLFEND